MERVGPPPPPQRPLSVGGAVLVVDAPVALPKGSDSTFGWRILEGIYKKIKYIKANLLHLPSYCLISLSLIS